MSTAIEQIAVGKLKVADDNIRRELGDLRELVASIQSVGMIEPIVARDSDQLVVCGARRLAAAKQAGLKDVPVILRPFTEQERIETMVVENLQREDLTPLEEALAFQRLVELGGLERDVAARVGRSQAHVAKRLGLLKLPETVQVEVGKGKITLEAAQELAKVSDDEKVVERIAKKATDGGSSYAVTNMVTAELDKRERAKQVVAAAKKLSKKDQEALVRMGSDLYQPKPPKGMKLVKAKSGYQGDDVVMDPAAHAKLECHRIGLAVVYGHDGVQKYEVCADPSQHPDPVAERKAAESKKEAAREKAEAAWNEVTLRRREYVRTIVAKVDAAITLEASFLALAQDRFMAGFGHEELACALLGEKVLDRKDEKYADPGVLLWNRATKSGAERQRVTFVLAVSLIEGQIGRSRWDHAVAAAYFELLGKFGYEPGKDEQKKLAESAS